MRGVDFSFAKIFFCKKSLRVRRSTIFLNHPPPHLYMAIKNGDFVEVAFTGKTNPKLLQLVSTSIFKKEKIMPQVGLQVSIDGQMGIIKTVTGGRTIVDFNHPLSGKMLHYKIKPIRVVTGLTEKTKALLEGFRMPPESVSVDEEKNAAVKMKQELPNEFLEMIGKKIKELIPELKEVNFTS